MTNETMDINLIIREKRIGVKIDVRKFPLLCPCCKTYLKKIFEHKGSRYGQVGSAECDNCGEKLFLTDSDNIVEYINISVRKLNLRIDFNEFFRMSETDFENLKHKFGYDIYEKHHNKSIELELLLKKIEEHLGYLITPLETIFPATISERKWLSLMQK